ncbi:MAG: hypothetical protein ABJC63_04425 [Gemmatimonadales bacterium]
MPAPRNRISRFMDSRMRLVKLTSAMAVGGLIVALSACAGSTPVDPKGQSVERPSPPVKSPATAPPFKAPSSPAHIYQETNSLYAFAYTYHGGILVSRYVLYDDGSFALQFASPAYGLFEYLGKYVRSDNEIRLFFNDANLGGPWEALGTVEGTRIRVVYNGIMIGADFENGVYQESPAGP